MLGNGVWGLRTATAGELHMATCPDYTGSTWQALFVGNDAALRGTGIPAPLSQRYMRSATVHT